MTGSAGPDGTRPPHQPLVDVAGEVYVAAARPRVAARLRDPAFWLACWPDLDLTVYHDRGEEGLRWYVGGALVGTAEVWLEPFRGAVVVHVYLRADPAVAPARRRAVRRLAERYGRALHRALFAMKDEREGRDRAR